MHMKKLWVVLLCLLLVLPLHVYADNMENQSQTESESQSSQPTESQPSQPSESQPSQPAETQPSQPVETQPSQPVETQPSQPTESQPSQPTESQPTEHVHVWDVSYTVAATCQEEGATAYGCSACGAISVEVLPRKDHQFSTQWSRNSSGHWHACSGCGEQGDFGKHYPGPAATEEKAQICLTCGYTLTAKLAHSHKYETVWTSDKTGHWYACLSCDSRKEFAQHSFDNGCDADCNICGYTTDVSHSYSGNWQFDGENHWDVCDVCREESIRESHIPGPEASETAAQICLTCGMELAVVPEPTEHRHTEEGEWLTDGENHWKLCACGETAQIQPHSWDEGTIQDDSTVLHICETCDAIRVVEEPENGVAPLIWIGGMIVVLLVAAAVLLLLISRMRKDKKFRK